MFKLTSITIICTVLLSCASEENRVKRKKYFGGEAIDVSALSYGDLNSGADINLLTYMEKNDLNHVFLLFGSVGCAKCNAKAKVVSHELMGQHELLLDGKTKGFELIGVNTDVGTARGRFEKIWNDGDQKSSAGYDFVKWSDPGAASVKNQLLDSGSNFAIPFMVLLGRDSLLTRYEANDERSIDVILDDVLRVVKGGQPIDLPPKQVEEQKPQVSEPGITPTISFKKSILDIPDRFSESAYHCATGLKTELSTLLAGKVTLIHLPVGNCDGSCEANRKIMQKAEVSCQNSDACRIFEYLEADGDGNFCETDYSLLGSSPLRSTYESAVRWRPELVNYSGWNEPESLQPEDRSIVLAFGPEGRLRYLHVGELSEQNIADLIAARFPKMDHIPEFNFKGSSSLAEEPQQSSLSEIVSRKKFTVFYEYGPGCASCDKKLRNWSFVDDESKGLVSFCRSKKDFCQIIALNKPMFGFQTPQTAYEQTRSHMLSQGISMPLYVDEDQIAKDAASDTFSRFFEGYLKPLFISEWADEFGLVLNGASVIYDQEGKIVRSIAPSTDPDGRDEVAESIYSLWLYQQGRVK
ncbi:hypothetical protein N9D31_03010 [Oligoflexaceae bacterium]|nr:hypothetical protein [Oligoflexaceae bacterium]